MMPGTRELPLNILLHSRFVEVSGYSLVAGDISSQCSAALIAEIADSRSRLLSSIWWDDM